jgi:hypothetical protein
MADLVAGHDLRGLIVQSTERHAEIQETRRARRWGEVARRPVRCRDERQSSEASEVARTCEREEISTPGPRCA